MKEQTITIAQALKQTRSTIKKDLDLIKQVHSKLNRVQGDLDLIDFFIEAVSVHAKNQREVMKNVTVGSSD